MKLPWGRVIKHIELKRTRYGRLCFVFKLLPMIELVVNRFESDGVHLYDVNMGWLNAEFVLSWWTRPEE
jgi:hypothetical protein